MIPKLLFKRVVAPFEKPHHLLQTRTAKKHRHGGRTAFTRENPLPFSQATPKVYLFSAKFTYEAKNVSKCCMDFIG